MVGGFFRKCAQGSTTPHNLTQPRTTPHNPAQLENIRLRS